MAPTTQAAELFASSLTLTSELDEVDESLLTARWMKELQEPLYI